MASTTVRSNALPDWAARLRNWLTVDQYARVGWKTDTPERTLRYRLHARIETLGESLLDAMFRRRVTPETDHATAAELFAAADLRAEDRSPATIP